MAGPARPRRAGYRAAVTALRVLAALVLAVVAAALAPDPPVTAAALVHGARGGLVATLGLLACVGAGAALCARLDPDALADDAGWLRALVIGHGALALVGSAAAFAGVFGVPVAAGAVGVGLAGLAMAPRLAPPRLPAVGAVLLAGLTVIPLIAALAPPTDTDEIYYQLALPRRMVETGGLLGGELHPDGSRPSPVQVVHAAMFALGGEAAPRLFHLGWFLALVLGVRTLAARRFGPGAGDVPAAALATSYSVFAGAGHAHADLPVAVMLLVAADAALDRRLVRLGWTAGLAVAAKYTAGPVAAALLLVAGWDALRSRALGRWALAGLLAAAPVLPWWLRNLAEGLHPLFPFAGWPDAGDFRFVYPEKYGAGRDLVATLLLPWNLLVRAETDSFVFLGRLSLAWAALAGGAALALPREPAARRLLVAVGLGFVAWAASAQILRYLLPLLGVAALAGGAARARHAGWLLVALSLPANLAPALARTADHAAAALGTEPRDTFLARALPSYGAARYLREHVPPDEPVALLNAWPAYHVRQPTLLGSVEDHVPTRHWVTAHGDASLAALRAAGARWLLVGEVKYVRRAYPFLDDATWRDQLRAPQERLERLLLRDAEKVWAEGHHAVYRLSSTPDSPPAP